MVTYQVIEETLEILEIGSYTTFGICVYQKAGDDPKQLSHVPDVFLHREEAERFAGMCNRLELDVSHLFDVIADIL